MVVAPLFVVVVVVGIGLFPVIARIGFIEEMPGGCPGVHWLRVLRAGEYLLEGSPTRHMVVGAGQANTHTKQFNRGISFEIPGAHGAQGFDKVIQHIGG